MDNRAVPMWHKYVVWFIGSMLMLALFVAICIHVEWMDYALYRGKTDYLTITVCILAFLTTVNMALAAIKIITSKSVEEEIDRQVKPEYNKLENRMVALEYRNNHVVTELRDMHIQVLGSTQEILMTIIQEHAQEMRKRTTKGKKSNRDRKLADFIFEVQKEAFAIMKMLYQTLSSEPVERLLGYQELATIGTDRVRNYLIDKAISEDDPSNHTFLWDEITNYYKKLNEG